MDIKAKFEDNNGFDIILTDDKVYVTSVGSRETFALRSVIGIGTYDDIEDFNRRIEEHKNKDNTPIKTVGIVFGLLGLLTANFGSLIYGVSMIIIGIVMFAVGGNSESPKDMAEMKSYFRIMLSGGDRKFQFDKKASNAGDVAVFCNKVEDTLTAYNDK